MSSYYWDMWTFKLPTWPHDYKVLYVSHKLNSLLIENSKHTNAFQTYLIMVYWFWGMYIYVGNPLLKKF